jgi:flavorubredoxin
LNENIEYYVNLYNIWSSYEAEDKGIFIAYCSLHGNTAKAAKMLAAYSHVLAFSGFP